MRWIKKNECTFFDGLDELYHFAKFGENRTTRAGCRFENVVFTGRIAAKRQTAGIKFAHRPKIRFFALQVRLVAPIHVKFGTADWHRVRLAVQHFTSIGKGVGMRPQNIKNFHFLVKSRPAGANPLTDFYKNLSYW